MMDEKTTLPPSDLDGSFPHLQLKLHVSRLKSALKASWEAKLLSRM